MGGPAVVKQKEIILLVEDNPRDQTIVTSALEHEGYEVEAASTGEEGLVALQEQEPQ